MRHKVTRWPVPLPLALAFLLLFLMVIGSLWLSLEMRQDTRATAANQFYGRAIADVVTNSRDAEFGQRGYLLTGDPAWLKPYTEAVGKVLPALEQVRETERAVGRSVYARLAPPIRRKLAELRATIALEQAGRHREALAAAHNADGLRTMMLARDILTAERQVVRDRTFAISVHSLRLTRLLTIGLVAGAALTVLLSLLFVRQSRAQFDAAQRARDAAQAALVALHGENAMREEAEGQVRQLQKMESLGQLTGGIAHDFNNMLAIVIGALDLAKRRLRTDPDRAERNIDAASEGAQRAAALTSRLLAFSRRQPLVPVATDVNRLVGGMSDLLSRTLGGGVRVETAFASGLWPCRVDAAELENVLLNLAVNARDAMPDGGRLTIATANVTRDAQFPELPAGDYVSVAVTDTGGGMPPDVLERAFDPFFTTKGVGKGTGLGLSQVFGFARQSGGHVALGSEVGVGTTVTLYLPRHDHAPAEAAPNVPADAPRGGDRTETVLVVEDEDEVRRFAVDALEELGYATLAPPSPAEALATLDGQQPVALLFTDVMMPAMNGRRLAELARRRRPDLPILFTTGYAGEDLAPAGALLPKPYTVADLARKVRDAIDRPV